MAAKDRKPFQKLSTMTHTSARRGPRLSWRAQEHPTFAMRFLRDLVRKGRVFLRKGKNSRPARAQGALLSPEPCTPRGSQALQPSPASGSSRQRPRACTPCHQESPRVEGLDVTGAPGRAESGSSPAPTRSPGMVRRED